MKKGKGKKTVDGVHVQLAEDGAYIIHASYKYEDSGPEVGGWGGDKQYTASSREELHQKIDDLLGGGDMEETDEEGGE